MNAYTLGSFFGALFACFIISRILRLILKKLGLQAVQLNLVVALLTAGITSMLGYLSFKTVERVTPYLVGTFVMFLWDSVRNSGKNQGNDGN